jgi:hypothetical protein
MGIEIKPLSHGDGEAIAFFIPTVDDLSALRLNL